jgi:hypothetical protein
VETSFNWTAPSEPSFEALIAASLADLTIVNRQSKIESQIDPYNPWKSSNGFRN